MGKWNLSIQTFVNKLLKSNRHTFLIIGIFILTFQIGCNFDKSLSHKIKKQIDKKCSSDSTCIISLEEITKFEWDKFYVFFNFSAPEIEKISTDTTDSRLIEQPGYCMIFINNGKVAYYEKLQEAWTSGGATDGMISIQIRTAEKGYDCFNKNEAIFKCRKIKEEPKYFTFKNVIHYYEMIPISN